MAADRRGACRVVCMRPTCCYSQDLWSACSHEEGAMIHGPLDGFNFQLDFSDREQAMYINNITSRISAATKKSCSTIRVGNGDLNSTCALMSMRDTQKDWSNNSRGIKCSLLREVYSYDIAINITHLCPRKMTIMHDFWENVCGCHKQKRATWSVMIKKQFMGINYNDEQTQ